MEFAGQVGAEVIQVAAAEVFAEDADTGLVVAVGALAAGQRAQFLMAFVVGIGQFAGQLPIVVKLVLDFAEYVGFVEFAFIPSGSKESIARQMQVLACFGQQKTGRI